MCSCRLPWQHIWGPGLMQSMEAVSGVPPTSRAGWLRGALCGRIGSAIVLLLRPITLACLSWHFGQPPKSCLGHSGAGGKLGEPTLKLWLDRRFAEGGRGLKIQHPGWDGVACLHCAHFSFFFLFSLLEYIYFLFFIPLVFLVAQQVMYKGLPAGFG